MNIFHNKSICLCYYFINILLFTYYSCQSLVLEKYEYSSKDFEDAMMQYAARPELQQAFYMLQVSY